MAADAVALSRSNAAISLFTSNENKISHRANYKWRS